MTKELEMPTLKDVFEKHEKSLEVYCSAEQILCDELYSVEDKRRTLKFLCDALVASGATIALEMVIEQSVNDLKNGDTEKPHEE